MNDNWFDEVKHNKFVEGSFTASIKVKCYPHNRLNLRPLITINGEIVEWQLMISDPPEIDYKAISNGPKPTPGSPIITPSVIRFHPDDVDASIDIQEELSELGAKYKKRWYGVDDLSITGKLVRLDLCGFANQKPS